MSRVGILLADGFEEVEGLAVVDVLRRAGISIDMVSVTGQLDLKTSRQIGVKADKLFEDMDQYEMIVLPGGLPGAATLRDDPKVIDLLKRYDEQGKYIAAICAGPMALGVSGVAKGRKVTSYPDDTTKSYLKEADYQEDMVVVDGRVITSRGPATAWAFAYQLVDLLGGNSNQLKEAMLYNRYMEK
ncbi:MAG: DJ-1/PfpI family protein [Erysipelotrichaceae bacterium]|nr:DJ-1/PfpI family protein [Erysipelotrichaceae bacterium]